MTTKIVKRYEAPETRDRFPDGPRGDSVDNLVEYEKHKKFLKGHAATYKAVGVSLGIIKEYGLWWYDTKGYNSFNEFMRDVIGDLSPRQQRRIRSTASAVGRLKSQYTGDHADIIDVLPDSSVNELRRLQEEKPQKLDVVMGKVATMFEKGETLPPTKLVKEAVERELYSSSQRTERVQHDLARAALSALSRASHSLRQLKHKDLAEQAEKLHLTASAAINGSTT